MKIFRHEAAKVFFKPSAVIIFALALILNGILLWLNEDRKYSDYEASAYRKICSDLSEYDLESACDTLKTQLDTLDIISYIQTGMDAETLTRFYPDSDISAVYEKYSEGNYLIYTDSVFSEQQLYGDVLNELESCMNYPQYLHEIIETADRMTSVSIFADPDSYSYNNIIRTPKAYEKLSGTELKFGASRGIRTAVTFHVTDIIAVIIIIGAVVTLISREREFSQLELAKAAYNGRFPLVTAKLTVCCAVAIISEILLYGVNFSVCGAMYGFGDLSRNIQSVYGFTGCHFDITVIEFLVLFLLAKLAVFLMITAIVFLIAVVSRKSQGVYIGIVLIMGSEALLYYTIENASYLSLLRNLNVIAFMNTYILFEGWKSFNFFSEPVSIVPVFVMGTLLAMILCSTVSVFIFSVQKKKTTKRRFAFIGEKLRCIRTYRTSSLFLHECYKVFIGGRVLLILLVFGALAMYTHTPVKEEFQSYNDVYYKQYIMKYSGKYTEEKHADILSEAEYFSKLENEFLQSDMDNIYSVMSYREKLAPYEALQEVQAHAEYLSSIDEGEFLYDSGYKLLTGAEGTENTDLLHALTAMVMLIMCTVCIYSTEYETGASILLNCSFKGRGHTFTAKLSVAFIITAVIFGITYLPQLIGTLKAYGTESISASAQCLDHLSQVSSWISIKEYLIILYVSRFIVMLLAVMLIFAISRRLKSYIASLAVSSVIIVMPIILALLDVPFAENILLNRIWGCVL